MSDQTVGSIVQLSSDPLPLLSSERKCLTDKIIQANLRADEQWAAALRFVNRIIVESDYLNMDQKTLILNSIWEKE